jgi:3'-5' exoribonuclease
VSRLPPLAELTPEDAGWGFYFCTSKEVRTGRSGSEFVIFTLQDRTAQITGKLLDEVARYRDQFDAGEFVRVDARASLYNGQLQLVVQSIRRVHTDQDRREGFREEDCVLSAARPVEEMWAELAGYVAAVRDPHLRVLLTRILDDHKAAFSEWPAAQTVHHAYRGGLLEHVVMMAKIGTGVARAYGANDDLVLAGVILHDIGKLQELGFETGTISYTRDGNLVGHIGLGLVLLRVAASGISGFPDELRSHLEHLVVSHHGSKEHGSPVEPKTIEAFILAAVDELDARIHQVQQAVRDDSGSEEFTGWHRRLGRVLYKGRQP